MKLTLITLLALLFTGGLSMAQAPGTPDVPQPTQPKPEQPKPEQPKPEQPKPEQPKAAVDYFALFKKVGRSWAHRVTTTTEQKPGEPQSTIAYVAYEVLEIGDKSIKLRRIEQDKDRKATQTQDLTFDLPAANGGDAPADNAVEETLKVEAGEYATLKATFGDSAEGATVWMSKEWPALTVKSDYHGPLKGKVLTELVEFKP